MAIQSITQKVQLFMTQKPRYVVTGNGDYLVQRPAENRWGFELCDAEGSWPGGHGLSSSWEVVDDADVPEDVKEDLGYLMVEDSSDEDSFDEESFDEDTFDDADTDDEGFFDDAFDDIFDGEE